MYRIVKRTLDFTAAAVLLLCLAPVMAMTALLVLVMMGRPVLFRQRRPGLHERLFTCLKFRTMADLRDSKGRLLPDEQRVTRLGRFLRRTSLDELPQLWNILTGELSFVGPRPLLTEYIPYYSPAEHRRHSVPPGLTGWAQIHGRCKPSLEERVAMDVWYTENASLALDLRILIATIRLVISQEGTEVVQTREMRLDLIRRRNVSDTSSFGCAEESHDVLMK
jgi:lipopolysaccharide/colanic/teichoic acid biosynthesis glycosyltransferase